jgi:hypothetical protein
MFGLSGRQIFILLVLAASIFTAAQYIPPYYTAFQFNDFVRQEVKYAATARRSIADIRRHVVEKAEELGIPDITARSIEIKRSGPSFTLDLEYRFPIDLKVYQHELIFTVSESGEAFGDDSD